LYQLLANAAIAASHVGHHSRPYGEATAYSVIDYPDEVAAATAQLSSNAAGYARVTIRPLLTAEEMDKAVAKWPPVRPPQQQ
jgi:hypothetical protein